MEKIENKIAPEITQETMEAIAYENFKRWNDALQTKDPKKVAELYTEDATFLPTLSGEFKRGKSGAEEYFKHFLEKNPIGEIVQGTVQTIKINNVVYADYYTHSGMYNFEVDSDKREGRHTVEARFTLDWKKSDQEEWKISHHHSSLKPVKQK